MKNSVNINTIKKAGHTLSAKKAIEAKQNECPHSNCDDDGNCHKCGKSALAKGIAYNPRAHKKLACDKVVSIVPKGELWRELVGVYWKGTNGASVLFETSPSKGRKIVEIFNSPSTKLDEAKLWSDCLYSKIGRAIESLKNALERDEVKNCVEYILDEFSYTFENDPNFDERELRNVVYGKQMQPPRKREVLSAQTRNKIKKTQKLLKKKLAGK